MPGDASHGEAWVRTNPTNFFPGDKDNPHQNEYYTKHPEMILGTVKGNLGRSGQKINVLGQVTPEMLDAAIARLPQNVLTDRQQSEAFSPGTIALAEYPAHGTHEQKRLRHSRGEDCQGGTGKCSNPWTSRKRRRSASPA